MPHVPRRLWVRLGRLGVTARHRKSVEFSFSGSSTQGMKPLGEVSGRMAKTKTKPNKTNRSHTQEAREAEGRTFRAGSR